MLSNGLNLELTPQMRNFIILFMAIVIVVLVIILLGSGKSKFRKGLSMFLADSDERHSSNRRGHGGGDKSGKNIPDKAQTHSKKPLTPGERYYEKDGGNQKYSSKSQVEMATLIRKSDDRLRVIDSAGKEKLFDEYYQLVFKTRKGQVLKIECSAKAYNAIPFNQQGSLTYQKNTLVKFKYIGGTVYNE